MENSYTYLPNDSLKISLPTAEATVALGRDLGAVRAHQAEAGRLHAILFFGELGAGKTTFTRGLVSALPGGEGAEVSSPSFTLYNIYPSKPTVLHCDLYKSGVASLPDDVAELMDKDEYLVLVEWAEHIIPTELPKKRLDIRFTSGDNTRLVTLSPFGETACSVLQGLLRLRGCIACVTPSAGMKG